MAKNLQNLWERMMTIGVNESVPESEVRYIRFTNVEALLTMFGVLLYVCYSFYSGYFLLGALQGIDVLLGLSVLLLNYKQQHKIARVVFLFLLNSIILIDACFIGKHSGIHEFFYISYTIPFLLFNVRDYKYIIGGVLLAVVGFNLYSVVNPYFTAYNIDVATQLNIFKINTWVIFVLFGLAVYILAYYNFKTENKLAYTNQKLQEQANELEMANSKLKEQKHALAMAYQKSEAQGRELKRSNEDLEQFGYIISHDLKAPVRNISSFMNLLAKQFGGEGAPKGAKEFIDMAKQSSDRLIKQIDDMLSYCRVDRNLPPTAPVDLNHMILTIKMELNEKIKEKNAEVIVERELPVLDEVHSSTLHHVFQNLIANAIKFNTTEKPEVKINYTEENGKFTFSVADNGIGIDSAYKSKLFQMFKRLHSVDQYEGTGIGLAVCKKIINFYNGEIWFEGEVNKGTTLFFTLNKPVAQSNPKIREATPVMKAA